MSEGKNYEVIQDCDHLGEDILISSHATEREAADEVDRLNNDETHHTYYLNTLIESNKKMSNIIKFPESESFKYIQYDGKMRGVEGIFDIGVTMHVEDNGASSLQIDSGGVILETTRKELSQFLWAAAYFLDSNQEWAESEYPALNK